MRLLHCDVTSGKVYQRENSFYLDGQCGLFRVKCEQRGGGKKRFVALVKASKQTSYTHIHLPPPSKHVLSPPSSSCPTDPTCPIGLKDRETERQREREEYVVFPIRFLALFLFRQWRLDSHEQEPRYSFLSPPSCPKCKSGRRPIAPHLLLEVP